MDHGSVPSRQDPDADDRDDDEENEILAELRMIRDEMLAEFPTGEALFRAIEEQEAELIRQGKIVIPLAAPPQLRPEPTSAVSPPEGN